MGPRQKGIRGGESSKRKGEAWEGDRPVCTSAARKTGETRAEGAALALEREVRR